MLAAHAALRGFSRCSVYLSSGRRRFLLSLASHISTREAHAVDLALKLNVLAVCAVFVFVGAILLGAF
jgi:hypothetical protein